MLSVFRIQIKIFLPTRLKTCKTNLNCFLINFKNIKGELYMKLDKTNSVKAKGRIWIRIRSSELLFQVRIRQINPDAGGSGFSTLLVRKTH